MSSKSVIVIGGGLAGLSSAVALADAGFRVRLLERRPFLGGRASSYRLARRRARRQLPARHARLLHQSRRFLPPRRRRRKNRHVRPPRLRRSRRPPRRHAGLRACRRRCTSRPRWLLYPSLTWAERHAIGHAMLAIARRGGQNCRRRRRGQDHARLAAPSWPVRSRHRRFWGVVLVSALNDELDRIDARYGLDVFWKAFLANRAGYRLGIPRVPLGELYDGCRAAIERQGGEVALRAPVRRVRIADGRVAAVEMDGGYEETADVYRPGRSARRRRSSCCPPELIDARARRSPICAICAPRPSPACTSGSIAT